MVQDGTFIYSRTRPSAEIADLRFARHYLNDMHATFSYCLNEEKYLVLEHSILIIKTPKSN